MSDPNTQKNIADALWLEDFDESKLPSKVKSAIFDNKNSNLAFGSRMRHHLDWLINHPQDNNPTYTKRYTELAKISKELTPQQAYIVSTFMLGNNLNQGFEQMPETANLQFPQDHEPKLKSRVDWHFFVGSCWDENNQEYGVEMMFFRVALLPPKMAAKLGLSDIENQVIELQLGISKAGERHHQADPVIIAGTTGLIDFSDRPFDYRFGNNRIQSLKKDNFLPVNIQARGIDRETIEGFKLGINMTFDSGKEYLFQGENGCSPCIAGMGTLYYSIPNLKLRPGSTIQYNDKTIKLKKGVFWFDHQWGFLSGNPDSKVLRAASNISAPGPAGWDWYMAQFTKDRQLTMYALHTKKNLPYYFQTGSNPPPTMKVPVMGKYMDENKNLKVCRGELTIDKWIKSEQTPNPNLYHITNAWHPNNWKFKFDKNVPEDIRNFSMQQIVPTAQTNFFANGVQYNEGAVYIKDKDGRNVGRGFAEAVQYANPIDNIYHITGISTNRRLKRALTKNTASIFKRFLSLIYLITHQKELKDVLKNAKGLEMMGGSSTKKRKHRHTSRF